jgi:hypothetical protein
VQDKLTVNEKGKGAFLAGLDDEQVELLFRHGHVLECEKGDLVIGCGQVTRANSETDCSVGFGLSSVVDRSSPGREEIIDSGAHR